MLVLPPTDFEAAEFVCVDAPFLSAITIIIELNIKFQKTFKAHRCHITIGNDHPDLLLFCQPKDILISLHLHNCRMLKGATPLGILKKRKH